MKNYTKVPNEIFENSQLSVRARFLFCVLFKYSGNDDYCFPGQKKLAKIMGYKDTRYIRTILKELEHSKMISIKRTGFNKTNTYKISKELYRNDCSCDKSLKERNDGSAHIGSAIPLSIGNIVPDNSTQLKEKDKNIEKNLRGLDKCREKLKRNGFKVGVTNKQVGIPIIGGGTY